MGPLGARPTLSTYLPLLVYPSQQTCEGTACHCMVQLGKVRPCKVATPFKATQLASGSLGSDAILQSTARAGITVDQGGFLHPGTQDEASYCRKCPCHLRASFLFVALSQDAGSQQIGFLLGSCGVTVALTSDACHKGLPKSPTGEIPQFKGMTVLAYDSVSALSGGGPFSAKECTTLNQPAYIPFYTQMSPTTYQPALWRDWTGGGFCAVAVVLDLMETPEVPSSMWCCEIWS